MKKSELCRVVQLTVLKDTELEIDVKLEVLKYLMDKEHTELVLERMEEKDKATESGNRNCKKYASTTPCIITDSTIAEVKAFERGDTENAENGK